MEVDTIRWHLLVAEYEQMREEINNRSRIQMTQVFAALAALGAAVSVVDTSQDVLVGAAGIISILSFLWSDHDKQINTLGAYVALKLEPALREASAGFTWESFFRKIDEGGENAADALYSTKDAGWRAASRLKADRHILDEYALLFYFVPLVLLIVYCVFVIGGDVELPDDAIRVGGVAVATGLWALSFIRREQRKHRRDIIRDRVKKEIGYQD